MAAPGFHMDPLLPLAVRKDPTVVPPPASGTARAVYVCTEGESIVRLGAGRQVIAAPALLKIRLDAEFRVLRRPAGSWILIVGGRLLDELVVAAFGEPGFSRFIEEIDLPGTAHCSMFDPELETSMCDLVAELETRAPAYRVRARSILTGILLLLYRASLVSPELRNGDGMRFGAVLDHIELHYDEDLKLTDLADLMGTSATYFSRLFRSEVGMPPFEYINRTRIRKACVLLRRPELPVTQIAFEVGYNNVSFFNRYFRRIMNQTPREYRRFLSS